jgi:hypothetical protein
MPGRTRFEPYVDPSISASRSDLGSRSPALTYGPICSGQITETTKIESTPNYSHMIQPSRQIGANESDA